MKHAVSPSLLRVLREGVEKGHWELEQIDQPPEGWIKTARVDRKHFRQGYTGVQHRNLLKDNPAANEAVQAMPDPKDFNEVLPPSVPRTQAPKKLPITLETNESDEFCPW